MLFLLFVLHFFVVVVAVGTFLRKSSRGDIVVLLILFSTEKLVIDLSLSFLCVYYACAICRKIIMYKKISLSFSLFISYF